MFIIISVIQSLLLVFSFHFAAKQSLSFRIPGQNDAKLFFSYSFIAFITNVIQFFAYRVDYWIVEYYHGKDELGLYALATKLGQMLWLLPTLLASIIFPQVADENKNFNEQKVQALLRITNTILLVVSLLIFLLAGWFIPLFAGEEYRTSVIPLFYILPGVFYSA
ncbi:MAG: oligosaccharide flippase family protein [Chitinophagaceae bacterium]